MNQIKKHLKTIRYGIEALFAYPVFYGFPLLPLEIASRLGGAIVRWAGPLMSTHRIARQNLRLAFPEWSPEKIEETLLQMWRGYGRICAEYAHAKSLKANPQRVTIEGGEIIAKLKEQGRPILFVGAHLSNWQVATLAADRMGAPIHQFYRPPNNPFLRPLMRNAQSPFVTKAIPKDPQGLKSFMAAFKQGLNLLLFFDQYNYKGIPLPFLGREALTAPTSVRLAKRFQYALVPFRVERLESPHVTFRVTFDPPLDLTQAEVPLLLHLNQQLEEWIRERPEQWFWVHNRWKQPHS